MGFAKRAGSFLTSEEWRIKAQNGKLILVGGGTRGTLYATFHLLEETVPARGVATIPQLNERGKPAFAYRDKLIRSG
jgi:hypothetical protein